ncbi:MAG: hypothetical protein L6290_11130 [Thermodesulfovibrionales bacterium]|nr:hypothetical protein [Thermodesulfovibrionales bacterium]
MEEDKINTYQLSDSQISSRILFNLLTAMNEQTLPGIKENRDILVPVEVLSLLFGITDRHVQRLSNEEKILKEVRGKYFFLLSIMNLVKHQRRLIEQGGDATITDLRKEEQKIKNELLQIELERSKKSLISVEEVKKSAMNEGKRIRDALNNIVPRIRALLAAETDELKCGDILIDELNRINDYFTDDEQERSIHGRNDNGHK